MKYKNPLTVIVVVAVVSAICGTWTLVHGQAPATSAPQPKPSTSQRQPNAILNYYPQGNHSSVWATAAAGAEDPEMAKLLEEEAGLAHESDELLGRYASSDDAGEQKRIRAELRETLAKQFDVQKQRRELELARIEERVKKLREQIKKRTDARETIVDRRLEQLVNEAEGLGWSVPSTSGVRDGQQYRFFRDSSALPAAQVK